MKHIAALSHPNTVPTKAADLDGVFHFILDVIGLLGGILGLIATKQDIAGGGTVE